MPRFSKGTTDHDQRGLAGFASEANRERMKAALLRAALQAGANPEVRVAWRRIGPIWHDPSLVWRGHVKWRVRANG